MVAVASPPLAKRGRLAAIDIVRGVAILGMIIYHASWDLSARDLIAADVVADTPWRIFARLIAGTFLALVGFNLVLATRSGFHPKPYLRRLFLIIASAALVSLGTYWFMPGAFVFFGILHSIALGSVLALPFLWLPAWVSAVVAVGCFLAPQFLRSSFFDAPYWWWLGLSTETPLTVDYVPVFPWFGVILGGVAAGKVFLGLDGLSLVRWQPDDPASRTLIFLGRWSLPIYLIHQPILIGLVALLAMLVGPRLDVLADRFTTECTRLYQQPAPDAPPAATYCGCILSGAQGANVLAPLMEDAMTPAEAERWQFVVDECRAGAPGPTSQANVRFRAFL